MKVMYQSPVERPGTYHPVLGWLKSGQPIELDDDIAKEYIAAGLLKKVKAKSIKARSPKPQTALSLEPGAKNIRAESSKHESLKLKA